MHSKCQAFLFVSFLLFFFFTVTNFKHFLYDMVLMYFLYSYDSIQQQKILGFHSKIFSQHVESTVRQGKSVLKEKKKKTFSNMYFIPMCLNPKISLRKESYHDQRFAPNFTFLASGYTNPSYKPLIESNKLTASVFQAFPKNYYRSGT